MSRCVKLGNALAKIFSYGLLLSLATVTLNVLKVSITPSALYTLAVNV